MKKQRSLDSRRQNLIKQVRKRQRRAKGQIHRDHLRARLNYLLQILEAPLPPDWPILYPELQQVLFLADGASTEWAVFESAAPWFAGLSRQRHFTLDMVILSYCATGAEGWK